MTISTKDDWRTIYGGDVEKDEGWQWDHPDATGPNAKEPAAEAEQKDAA